MPDPSALPFQAAQVFHADDIFVSHGVNLDEGLALPGAVVMGDIYSLDDRARPLKLLIIRTGEGAAPHVAAGSDVGTPGDPVHTQARYTFMGADGTSVDLMLLAHGGAGGTALYALPLSPLGTRTDYTLVNIDTAPEEARLADLMCISFARGTMVTMAGGAQRAIESLAPGDKVLTRDHGPQPVRWLGRATLRAVGAFAPVVIAAGTLGNAGDLIVSQHHRMFLYQRKRTSGMATSELLVQARHLVDDDHVFIREGGFIDYFALVFDRHEIIYAEGVPAESLMVNDATVNRLPGELADDVKARFPGLAQVQHFGTEAGRQFLESVGPTTLYQPRRPKR